MKTNEQAPEQKIASAPLKKTPHGRIIRSREELTAMDCCPYPQENGL